MKPAPTYVYVARNGIWHKIGISADVAAREKQLGAVEMVRYWHRPNDARQVEREAHKLLAEDLAHQTEWFDVTEGVAICAVRMAIRQASTGRRSLHLWELLGERYESQYEATWRALMDEVNATLSE